MQNHDWFIPLKDEHTNDPTENDEASKKKTQLYTELRKKNE